MAEISRHRKMVTEWYGLQRLKECWIKPLTKEETSEVEFEKKLFLSIFRDTTKDFITTIELGAGWGAWCLATAGVIRNNLVPTTIKDYYCIGVEAEPTHFKWLKVHFKHSNINGVAINRIAAGLNGYKRFDTGYNPSTNYGQSTIRGVVNLLHLITGKTTKVQCITLDELTTMAKGLCFVHMDIQGSELEVMSKCKNLERIDYLFIGVHSKKIGEKIRKLLHSMELIVYLPPKSVNKEVSCGDGIQFYKKRA